jgi:hypothetical protein
VRCACLPRGLRTAQRDQPHRASRNARRDRGRTGGASGTRPAELPCCKRCDAFLERLAAITPRPRINLVLYHGVLAPRARRRPRGSSDPAVVPPPAPLATASAPLAPPVPPPTASGSAIPPIAASPAPSPVPPAPESPHPQSAVRPAPSPSPRAPKRPQHAWAWADLMRRVFSIDVLACAGCGGRLRFIATIETPETQSSKSRCA